MINFGTYEIYYPWLTSTYTKSKYIIVDGEQT